MPRTKKLVKKVVVNKNKIKNKNKVNVVVNVNSNNNNKKKGRVAAPRPPPAPVPIIMPQFIPIQNQDNFSHQKHNVVQIENPVVREPHRPMNVASASPLPIATPIPQAVRIETGWADPSAPVRRGLSFDSAERRLVVGEHDGLVPRVKIEPIPLYPESMRLDKLMEETPIKPKRIDKLLEIASIPRKPPVAQITPRPTSPKIPEMIMDDEKPAAVPEIGESSRRRVIPTYVRKENVETIKNEFREANTTKAREALFKKYNYVPKGPAIDVKLLSFTAALNRKVANQ